MGLLRRNGAELHCLFVEEAEIQIHEIDPPDAILFLLEADGLIGQGLADKERVLSAKVDRPIRTNDSDEVVVRIAGFGQSRGIAFQ